jgi:hypothetical protein
MRIIVGTMSVSRLMAPSLELRFWVRIRRYLGPESLRAAILVHENRLSPGAARGIRTPDPIITNDVLYQLSYCGVPRV